jgi:hypothetical protein
MADSNTDGIPNKPRDALAMAEILRANGVTKHDPQVINQMLEYMYRK